ncbi:unnamed protein product [Clonostachys chloroleuca]|uniref:Zn(2)-C6 fungal-type domain-containing protein n=1 Tax=Clonostachys chloroleuca TaxID=1926264 RepID=A0AA35PWJ6_9HYPO|nr:unnamed protein product [Clonostachys chloroleuca]
MDRAKRAACDPCRRRKVKCDRNTPCSNCQATQQTCVTTGFGQSHTGARQRVLISAQYEEKIDGIQQRLDGIEHLLRELLENSNKPATNRPSCSTTLAHTLAPALEVAVVPSGNPTRSTLAAQTLDVGAMVENTVKQTPSVRADPDVAAALSALHRMVQMHHQKPVASEIKFPDREALPEASILSLPLVPLNVVLPLLRGAKERPSPAFAATFNFMTLERFTEYCRAVYFATEPFTLSSFAIVNGGLYYMLTEKAYFDKSQDVREEYTEYRNLCAGNLRSAINSLGLLISTCDESIEALLVGASYAIEVSRPSLAWRMSSTAAQICQELGYHSLYPKPTERDGHKINYELLGALYILDKGLALRLGRASALPDQDIVGTSSDTVVDMDDLWQAIKYIWVQHAQIQGRIYDQLYSRQALLATPAERVRSAVNLAEATQRSMRQLMSLAERPENAVHGSASGDFGSATGRRTLILAEVVCHLSTLTLIYRSIHESPRSSKGDTRPSSDYVETARAAFRYHEELMVLFKGRLETQAYYIHWTLLFTPFTPLLVVFCHVFESLDPDDLHMLQNFTTSLEPVRHMSESIDQLHSVATTLYNVASSYLRARTKATEGPEAQMLDDSFTGYLNQLGLLPAPDEPYLSDARLISEPSQTMVAENWFSANLNLFGLLEGDFAVD